VTLICLIHFVKSVNIVEEHRNLILFTSRILCQPNFLLLEFDTMRVRGGHAVSDFWPCSGNIKPRFVKQESQSGSKVLLDS
jgi:hypothetical protein